LISSPSIMFCYHNEWRKMKNCTYRHCFIYLLAKFPFDFLFLSHAIRCVQFSCIDNKPNIIIFINLTSSREKENTNKINKFFFCCISSWNWEHLLWRYLWDVEWFLITCRSEMLFRLFVFLNKKFFASIMKQAFCILNISNPKFLNFKTSITHLKRLFCITVKKFLYLQGPFARYSLGYILPQGLS